MKTVTYAVLLLAATTLGTAQAQESKSGAGPTAQIMTSVPGDSATVTHWYKQNVYDPADNKIGEIDDVLVDKDGKATALMIGVGGFLGMGEKHVAVPWNAVRTTSKNNNKFYLVMNSTKDALKNAPGFKYDRNAMTWTPEGGAPATQGQSPRSK
jgi:sporulation protein YlmC with PRC-barrel domain